MTTSKILVPLDGLPPSRVALRHALALAKRSGDTEVLGLHVIDREALSGFFFEALEREAETIGETAKGIRDREFPDAKFSFSVVHGDPVDDILARLASCDLAIMGTHGRKGFDRLALGSVTELVIRSSTKPIIALRMTDQDSAKLDKEPSYKSMLVAFDNSDPCKAFVSKTIPGLLKILQTETITLFHAVELPEWDEWDKETARKDAQEMMDDAAQTLEKVLKEQNVSTEVKTKVDLLGSEVHPSEVIAAETEKADGLFIATHGRRGLERVLLGSTAEQILRTIGKGIPVVLPGRKSM